MNDYNKNIGQRIKELRELSDIEIKTIVNDLDIDEKIYNQYENGEIDIPASFIYEISHYLGVDMTLLLTGEETRMNIFDVTRANKSMKIERKQEYKYENLCLNLMHKKAEMFIVTVDPKDKKPSLNTHPGQEFNYILEGSVKLYIHNHEIILNEGDSIMFDSTHRHAISALNNKKAKFLAVLI